MRIRMLGQTFFFLVLGKFELEPLSSEILMYSRRILCAASLNVSVSFTKAERNDTTQRYRILIIMLRKCFSYLNFAFVHFFQKGLSLNLVCGIEAAAVHVHNLHKIFRDILMVYAYSMLVCIPIRATIFLFIFLLGRYSIETMKLKSEVNT